MKIKTDHLIKKLQEYGKTYISHNELLAFTIPNLKNIDDVIDKLKKFIIRKKNEGLNCNHSNKSVFSSEVFIARPTVDKYIDLELLAFNYSTHEIILDLSLVKLERYSKLFKLP